MQLWRSVHQRLKGGKEECYVFRAARVPHQANAPNLVFQSTKAGGYFDVVSLQQLRAHRMRINPRRCDSCR
jgi:hypothetical protein